LLECYGSRGSRGPNENALHPEIGQPDHLLSRAVLFGGAIGFLPCYVAQGKGARFCDHEVAISAAPCTVAMDCCAAAIQAKELIRGCDSLLRVDHASDLVLTSVLLIELFIVPIQKMANDVGEPEVETPRIQKPEGTRRP
jgi:hypothetical protein